MCHRNVEYNAVAFQREEFPNRVVLDVGVVDDIPVVAVEPEEVVDAVFARIDSREEGQTTVVLARESLGY